MKKIFLGIDPGRMKTGLALVDERGGVLALRVARTEELERELEEFARAKAVSAIVLGDGTNAEATRASLERVFPELAVHLVREAHSTEEARVLYWQLHPPKGWRKLLPLGLLVPPEPLDAYAAVVQARRFLGDDDGKKHG